VNAGSEVVISLAVLVPHLYEGSAPCPHQHAEGSLLIELLHFHMDSRVVAQILKERLELCMRDRS